MATTTNKQRLVERIFNTLKKNYDPAGAEERPVLEEFVYGLCREGASPGQADQAYRTLTERFFDWNEVRVSSQRELEEVLADLPEPEARAQRLVAFLQEVFETTFSFDLQDLLNKKGGLKAATKHLSRYQAASDFVVSWVTQRSLGGHAIPLDLPTLRVLGRLGLIDGEEGLESVRGSLEHLVPKARAPLFTDLVSTLAGEVCLEDAPNCAGCPLAADCPIGQTADGVAVARTSRVKPR